MLLQQMELMLSLATYNGRLKALFTHTHFLEILNILIFLHLAVLVKGLLELSTCGAYDYLAIKGKYFVITLKVGDLGHITIFGNLSRNSHISSYLKYQTVSLESYGLTDSD